MTAHPTFKPFNFQDWIARNKGSLKPPVANKQLFDHKTGMTVMIVGGPNRRVDFHDDPVEEFFYQLEGDMVLKIAEGGKIYDVNIRQGEVFILPPHVRHSPQRPVAGSVGLVVEGTRAEAEQATRESQVKLEKPRHKVSCHQSNKGDEDTQHRPAPSISFNTAKKAGPNGVSNAK